MLFDTPPPDFKPKFHVTACYVEWRGKILYLCRSERESHTGSWGLPAGGIEQHETPKQAAVRELKEEAGITATPAQLTPCSTRYVRRTKDFIFHTFLLKCKEPPHVHLDGKEHTEFTWVTPQEALKLHHLPDGEESLRRDWDLDESTPKCL